MSNRKSGMDRDAKVMLLAISMSHFFGILALFLFARMESLSDVQWVLALTVIATLVFNLRHIAQFSHRFLDSPRGEIHA